MTKAQQIKRLECLSRKGHTLRDQIADAHTEPTGETIIRDDEGNLINTGKDSGTIVDASPYQGWAKAVEKEARRGTSFSDFKEVAQGFEVGTAKKHALEQTDKILLSFDEAIKRFHKLPWWKRLLSYTFLHRYLNP